MKKAAIIIVLVFVVPLCLFADDPMASTSFTLIHEVLTETKYAFSFRSPSSVDTVLSSVDLSEENNGSVFALFVLSHNKTLTIQSLTATFTDLLDSEQNYCPYVMSGVFDPNGVLGTSRNLSAVLDNDGHGRGYIELVSEDVPKTCQITDTDGSIVLASLIINIDLDSASAGTFTGEITMTYVVI